MKNLEVEITNLDHFGRGIVKKEKPIFIDNALVGEIVEIEITKDNKKYSEGRVIKYIKKSPLRVESNCPFYDKCGGCDLLHLSYQEQLKYKETKVKEIIKKFSGLECVKEIVPTIQYNYRNKVTLHVKQKLGYYQKKSYDIINIDNCLIADERINDLIKKLNNIDLNTITKITIRVSSKESMLVIEGGKLDIALFEEVDTIIVDNQVLKGRGYIIEEINNLKFVISPDSFFQVNRLGMINIYNQVLKYVDNDTKVLDLYCGTGTIGIYLADKVNQVLGIEINKSAINDALMNKKINNLENIDFKLGDVEDVLNNNSFKADCIVVDPPRAGLGNMVIKNIFKIQPQKLIYVSCDPVTLARDLNILKDKYDVVEITPFDMFSNTYHVECVGLLCLKKCQKSLKNKRKIGF